MARHLRQIFLLLVLCSLSLTSPVFFPEEAADGPGAIAAAGGGSSASGVVQKENADKDKLGEKAIVAEDVKGVVPGGLAKSDEVDDSASDENEENSTEPVKKLLIRTFTDLHPKVALELINKTLSIANATDLEEAKKSGDAWSVGDTETTTEQDESTTVPTVQETTTTGTTTEQEPELKSSGSSTEVSSTSSTASSTTVATTESSAQSTLPATSSSTTPSAESSSVASTSSSSTTSTTETPSSTTELIKEKEIGELEAEIEADPVILTQGV